MPALTSRIPWRLKSVAFRVLSHMPLGVHRWLSTHVTGRSLRDLSDGRYFRELDAHLSALERVPNSKATALMEFGAGADLFSSFYFFSKGVRRQLVVDLERNVTPQALNALLAQCTFLVTTRPFTNEFESELQEWGITYRAPYDLRDAAFEERSIGFICSTNTLEHIPKVDLVRIFTQCGRIVQENGVLSMWIDYSDHYSHTDPSINAYNFLQYSAREWAGHNSRLQYQNRLRHCQYKRLFLECGFEVLQDTKFHPQGWRTALSQVDLHDDFVGLPVEEVGATSGHFVLRLATENR
jgi:hypothetical protein